MVVATSTETTSTETSSGEAKAPSGEARGGEAPGEAAPLFDDISPRSKNYVVGASSSSVYMVVLCSLRFEEFRLSAPPSFTSGQTYVGYMSLPHLTSVN